VDPAEFDGLLESEEGDADQEQDGSWEDYFL
jgi:hypothetical protein